MMDKKRASTIWQEQDLCNESGDLRRDLQLSGYPQGFIELVINSDGNIHPNKEIKLLYSVYIPHVKSISES
jgi:hypothetical protein